MGLGRVRLIGSGNGHRAGDGRLALNVTYRLPSISVEKAPVYVEIRRTPIYKDWLSKLKDGVARARIITRVDRLEEGNSGDSRSVGSGVVELRINFGPGYRVYYIQRGEIYILLLCGGDKSTQSKDIERAKLLAATFEDE